MTEELVLGIDLGTTNSCVSIFYKDENIIVPNHVGEKNIPSVVTILPDGERIVGTNAKRQAIVHARSTISVSKRFMGLRWDTEERKKLQLSVPYRIQPSSNNEIQIVVKDQTFTPSEIGSMILSELKLIAESFLGKKVKHAVITVPAYFNDMQRQATKNAGKMAGLDVLRVLNEPTAAALAYGVNQGDNKKKKKIVVYDLGGGTFDVTILEFSNGIFDVKYTTGDSFLGGEDFDQKVVAWLIQDLIEIYGGNVLHDSLVIQRLKEAAERARMELSNELEVEINVPFLLTTSDGKTHHIQKYLTRQRLNDLTEEIVDRTLSLCEKALEESHTEKKEIDDIILVGGMTLMPFVREKTKEFFGKELTTKEIHPHEVVARGAAIQGHSLVSGNSSVLLDVTPHNLGVVVAGELFKTLIEKNTKVPCSKSEIFTTTKDNQKEVLISILQGDSLKASENTLLGEFVFGNLVAAPRGDVAIVVKFEISIDGIVSVSAHNKATQAKQSVRVRARDQLSITEAKEMLQENLSYLLNEKAEREFTKQKKMALEEKEKIKTLFAKVEKKIEKHALFSKSKFKLETLLTSLDQALKEQNFSALISLVPELTKSKSLFSRLDEYLSEETK